MAREQRPGGLTALAVFNFIFGGFASLGFLGVALGGAVLSSTTSTDPEVVKAKEALEGIVWLVALYYAVQAFLLIASGVGYLKMKRTLGRYFGNAYALLAIGLTVVLMVLGQPFGLMTVVGLVYPVLTLALLNTTFKEDLVQ